MAQNNKYPPKQENIAASEYGKVPPQALELEEAVLGAVMLEKDAIVAVLDILKPESFYKETHQKIKSIIQKQLCFEK